MNSCCGHHKGKNGEQGMNTKTDLALANSNRWIFRFPEWCPPWKQASFPTKVPQIRLGRYKTKLPACARLARPIVFLVMNHPSLRVDYVRMKGLIGIWWKTDGAWIWSTANRSGKERISPSLGAKWKWYDSPGTPRGARERSSIW